MEQAPSGQSARPGPAGATRRQAIALTGISKTAKTQHEDLLDDPEVTGQRPVPDILEIPLDLPGKVETSPAGDLPGTDHARQDLEPEMVGLGVGLQEPL